MFVYVDKENLAPLDALQVDRKQRQKQERRKTDAKEAQGRHKNDTNQTQNDQKTKRRKQTRKGSDTDNEHMKSKVQDPWKVKGRAHQLNLCRPYTTASSIEPTQ
jgi:hypothetical protein